MSVIGINKDNFQNEVINSSKPVLLDICADWCGPCRMVSPIVDEIAEGRSDIRAGKSVVSKPKTKSSIRTIILPPDLVEALADYKRYATCEWMFPSPMLEGQPRNPTADRHRGRI